MVTPYETPLACNEKKSSTKTTRERIFVHNTVDSPEGSQQQRSQQEQERVSCAKCAGNHRLSDCDDFRSIGTNQRWELVKEKRLCFCCFLRHRAQQCKSKKKCHVDGWESTHHVLLHTPTMSGSKVEHMGQGSNHRIKASESALMFHGSSASKTLFRYVPITLYSKSKRVRAYALVDEGAECTLIERALADELELDGPATQLCHKWTGDITKNEPESMSVAVSISAPEHNAIQYALKNVRTIANLDLPEQGIGPQLLKSRKHLSTLPILPYNNVKGQLIIGLDNIKIKAPLEIREAENDDVIAARSRLGWAVYGRPIVGDSTTPRLLHICQCSAARGMDEALKNYF
ncbi:uncharacterized protein [Drosophila virilis]|uniref:uncharacterized protein n=1 Tax=Drosophila virilis TaxID=7244 RepID=UPI0038B2E9DF